MTTTPIPDIIPESAPFSAQQRAWLNGFFAGWMGVAGNTPAANRESPPPQSQVEERFPWHDPAMPIDQRMSLAEGKPLQRRLMAAMAQLDCGACGYLCQTYAEAIADGVEGNLKLCQPGGRATATQIKSLVADVKLTVNSAPAVVAKGATRANPATVRLVESTCLNGPKSAKDTRHVILDLADSGITYEPGDALGVYPFNCDELIALLLGRLDASGQEEVQIDNEAMTFVDALRTRCDLRAVEPQLIELLKEHSSSSSSERLAIIEADQSELDQVDVLDLLDACPNASPEPQHLVAALGPLMPRLYSIASSQRAHPRQVHLTVGKVVNVRNGRLRRGVASTMFAERIHRGDALRVFIQHSHGFALPQDAAAPIIMVGPGTGVAPFLAFLQHRAAAAAGGRNWLFFGDQHKACDYLYRDELEGYQQQGILTRLSTAFSRDQEEKIYVQDRMLEHAEELFDWLEAGAHFYVCGDARRMAGDVDKALRKIIARSGADPDAYVDRLKADGRYQRDVY